MRARFEAANIDGSDDSQAYTIRTRAGLLARPFAGGGPADRWRAWLQLEFSY